MSLVTHRCVVKPLLSTSTSTPILNFDFTSDSCRQSPVTCHPQHRSTWITIMLEKKELLGIAPVTGKTTYLLRRLNFTTTMMNGLDSQYLVFMSGVIVRIPSIPHHNHQFGHQHKTDYMMLWEKEIPIVTTVSGEEDLFAKERTLVRGYKVWVRISGSTRAVFVEAESSRLEKKRYAYIVSSVSNRMAFNWSRNAQQQFRPGMNHNDPCRTHFQSTNAPRQFQPGSSQFHRGNVHNADCNRPFRSSNAQQRFPEPRTTGIWNSTRANNGDSWKTALTHSPAINDPGNDLKRKHWSEPQDNNGGEVLATGSPIRTFKILYMKVIAVMAVIVRSSVASLHLPRKRTKHTSIVLILRILVISRHSV